MPGSPSEGGSLDGEAADPADREGGPPRERDADDLEAAPDEAPKSEGPPPSEEPPTHHYYGASFAGPIPPPALFREYEEILPGSADRILKLAEDQSDHRQTLERRALNGNIVSQLLGQFFAFALGLSGAYLAWRLIEAGDVWKGMGFFLADLITLATVFVVAQQRGERELAEKREGEGDSDAEQQELPLAGSSEEME